MQAFAPVSKSAPTGRASKPSAETVQVRQRKTVGMSGMAEGFDQAEEDEAVPAGTGDLAGDGAEVVN